MNLVPLQLAPTLQNLMITYLEYEPPKTTFFEQKAATSMEEDNNLISEFGQMKKTMSQINNNLMHLRF